MEKIKLNKLKIISLLLLPLLFSCNSYYNKSLNSLSEAFNFWYLIHNPQIENSLNPYNFYIKNNNMKSNFDNEYITDIKRFKLELMQIDKTKLHHKNLYIYNSIEKKINDLIFSHKNFRFYQYDPSYYYKIINNHLLNILIEDKSSNSYKVETIIETLDIIPSFISQIPKSILISNDFFIKRSNLELNKINQLISDIPLYLDLDNEYLDLIITKVEKNKKYLKINSEWLNKSLDTNFELNIEKITDAYNEQILFLEDKYKYTNLLNSLEITIKSLQNSIFDLSLPLYLKNNDEPIWLDRQDTLDVVNYVITNELDNKSIELDNTSKIISFNSHYNDILSILNSQGIIETNKFNEVSFPDYDYFFEQDNSIILLNDSYNEKNIEVIFNNNYEYINTNEIYLFIINEVIIKHIFNLYTNGNNNNKNNVSHYSWGNLLYQIIINNSSNIFDPKFQIYYNMHLLKDFTMLLSKYKYISGDLKETEALSYFFKESFIKKTNEREKDWFNGLYGNDFNFENYAAYIYMSNLYDDYCLINKKISTDKMIKKIFEHGFIPVINYKTILN